MKYLYYYNTKTPFRSGDKEISDSELYINCAGIVDEENYFSNKSIRDDFYFLYLQKGKLKTSRGDLFAGDFIIFPPNETYSYESCGHTAYLFFAFQRKLCKRNRMALWTSAWKICAYRSSAVNKSAF